MRQFKWGVVGSGPAGIAALGKLLDNGINPQSILWLDTEFKAGMLGKKWRSVHSNTTVELFDKFLTNCKSFNYNDQTVRSSFSLSKLDPRSTCQLYHVADPLQYVTDQLCSKVNWKICQVGGIDKSGEHWKLSLHGSDDKDDTKEEHVLLSKVILAIGSVPKMVHVKDSDIPVIPLDEALQIDVLKQKCDIGDAIGVFGSSHSAIMIIRDLLSFGNVKKVINFYRSPLLFAEYRSDGGIVNDSTGLKGKTAQWARDYLLNENGEHFPKNLVRVVSNDDNMKLYLKQCSKVIYAVGFKRQDILINGKLCVDYDDKTGIISDGLFGVGIAFPELAPDAVGNLEHQVGMWKFMKFLDRMVPQWIQQ